MTNSILAIEFVIDTMGLILRVEQRKSSPTVTAILDSVESGNTIVYVPTLVFAEILYLSEKNRISTSLETVIDYLKQYENYKDYPMSLKVIQVASQIEDIRELHDRLISATARLLNLQLITNDPTIQASSFVQTIW
jgi:predicted nucleic acid-binding protein